MAYLYTQDDIRDALDACAQSVKPLPVTGEAELYRVGYLMALRQFATICGIHRSEPIPRRPLPELIEVVRRG